MEENYFTVLPMSQRFSLEAGGTYTGSITIANPASAKSDFSYLVSVVPYNMLDSSYNPDSSDPGAYTAIADWITIENPTGTLAPNALQTVNFTIKVPEGTPAGGQYAALVVSKDPETKATEDAVNVQSVLELASIIYADVSGVTIRDGSVLENHIPGFSFDPSIVLDASVQNNGNVHSDATVEINVTNLLTGEVVFPEDDSSDKFQEIILPGSTRYITRRVDHLPPLGVVRVTQTVYFYDQAYTTEQDVVICPLWFIVLAVITVASVIAAILMRVFHRRKKNKNL